MSIRFNPKFVIEKAVEADIDEIISLLYPGYFLESMYRDLTFSRERTEDVVRFWISQYMIVTRIDGKIVGFSSVYGCGTFFKEDFGEFGAFYILPEYRKTRIAREMLKLLTEEADRKGLAYTFATCGVGMGEKNEKVYQNLCGKFGFKRLSTMLIRGER